MTPEGSVFVMPQNVFISEGNSVTFMCVVDVAGSYELQWSHNGEVLLGENRTLLNVNAVTAAQGGSYTCSVVNVAGSGMDEGILYGMSHYSSHAQRAHRIIHTYVQYMMCVHGHYFCVGHCFDDGLSLTNLICHFNGRYSTSLYLLA